MGQKVPLKGWVRTKSLWNTDQDELHVYPECPGNSNKAVIPSRIDSFN